MTRSKAIKLIKSKRIYHVMILNLKLDIEEYSEDGDLKQVNICEEKIRRMQRVIDIIMSSFKLLDDKEFIVMSSLIDDKIPDGYTSTGAFMMYGIVESSSQLNLSKPRIYQIKNSAIDKMIPMLEEAQAIISEMKGGEGYEG